MRPSRRFIKFIIAWFALGLASAFIPALGSVWLAIAIILSLIVSVEWLSVWREPRLLLKRAVSRNLPIDSWNMINLYIENKGTRNYQLELFDYYPQDFEVADLPLSVALAAGNYAHLQYRLKPTKRGDAKFSGVEVVVLSMWGFWRRHQFFVLEDQIKVFPNFAEVTKYALLATDNHLSQLGVRHKQRRGEGKEFHQLREYREGDDLRSIDWKASAKVHKLIAKEYQDERDQQILFMVDCGRRMRAEDDGIKHFDQALNAMLLLSYVALRQGDAVGFISFAGCQRWFPPSKGHATVNRILNQVYDIDVTSHAADYATAAKELLARQRKRSLVIILTNTRDEDQEELVAAIRLLRTRHLVLLANLREESLDKAVEMPVTDFEAAINYVSTVDYVETRRQSHNSILNLGAIAVDVTAEQLPISIVNQYLDIKSSGRL